MMGTDNLTLEEIGINDREMHKEAIKGSRRVTFFDREQAKNFIMHCLRAAVERLGLPNAHKMSDEMLDRVQKNKGIKVEWRGYYAFDDDWRNGFYVYKNDELVAFISEIVELSPNRFEINRSADRYCVVTNAKGVK